MILSSDNSIYTGITTDIKRRWQQHSSGIQGAKFFRGRKPKSLLYLETGHTKSSALRREVAIKKMSKQQKWLHIHNSTNQAKTLKTLLPIWTDNCSQKD